MPRPHQRHDHDPPRLIRALRALGSAVAAVALAPGLAHAAGPRPVALPSPITPLSAAPPLSGGATASGEAIRHRVRSQTVVDVSIDPAGRVFRLVASQRLRVAVTGDYSFTIRAPLIGVRAASGSEREPGLRADSYLWEGFNPGTRILAAVVGLRPGAASDALPVRVEVRGSRITLINATGLNAGSFTADVDPAPLRAFFRTLAAAIARGQTPPAGLTVARSAVRPGPVHITSPVHVSGTIGAQRVDVVLGGAGHPMRASFAAGAARLRVDPLPPATTIPSGLSDRALLRRAIVASLEYARWRQYEQFLGNPDPAGLNTTEYRYASGRRPTATAAPVAPRAGTGRGTLATIALIGVGLVGVALAVAIWARA